MATEVLHIVSGWQHLLDRIGLKVPRPLCGASLIADDSTPDPGPDAPVCLRCAAIEGRR